MINAINLNTSVINDDVTKHEGTKHFKVYVYFCGVKKRCRKSEMHNMKVTYIDYNNGEYDKDSLTTIVREFLDTNVKHVDPRYNVRVSLEYISRSFERGFSCEVWEPFSKLNTSFLY